MFINCRHSNKYCLRTKWLPASQLFDFVHLKIAGSFVNMEDGRLIWMKECIYAALGLQEDKLFAHLLTKDEDKVCKELVSYLDRPSKQYSPALIFYPIEHEVEEIVEVVEGTILFILVQRG